MSLTGTNVDIKTNFDNSLLTRLTFIRVLEAFDIDILTEYRVENVAYLEKWCASIGDITRTLLIKSEDQAIEKYLSGQISMLNLLVPSDGVRFIVGRQAGVVVSIERVSLKDIPENYLPKKGTMHDPSLRPERETNV